jgi:hypothetical protein
LDLRARRPPVRRRSAGGGVLLLARSRRHSSRAAGYSEILQADAYAGFNTVYRPERLGGPITEATCRAHGRRKFFELADIASKARSGKQTTISPMALGAVQRIDATFMAERSINGLPPDDRLAARRKDVAGPRTHRLDDR